MHNKPTFMPHNFKMQYFPIKKIRQFLGMTPRKFAELIGLHGENVGDRIDELEKGKREISGPIAMTLESMSQLMYHSQFMPRWIKAQDLSGADDAMFVGHTHYPRFWARFVDAFPHSTDSADQIFDIRLHNYRYVVFSFIDHPVGDQEELLGEAIRQIETSSI